MWIASISVLLAWINTLVSEIFYDGGGVNNDVESNNDNSRMVKKS